jgi:hypothetical protein
VVPSWIRSSHVRPKTPRRGCYASASEQRWNPLGTTIERAGSVASLSPTSSVRPASSAPSLDRSDRRPCYVVRRLSDDQALADSPTKPPMPASSQRPPPFVLAEYIAASAFRSASR